MEYTSTTQLAATSHSSLYGYKPTAWICILFVVLFSVSTLIHIAQVFYIRPRLYWILPTIVCCGVCEILGWAARLWSSSAPIDVDPYLMQITTTIIAPTFLTAAFYTIIGRVIPLLGARYSRLTPKTYLITFLIADVIALIFQAVGGAKASHAFRHDENVDLGSHIMLVGIFLQMAGIVLYLFLAAEFILRVHLNKPLRSVDVESQTSSSIEKTPIDSEGEKPPYIPQRTRIMILALLFATVLIFMRSVYRSIELIGGWRGRVITTERYFNILDGAPVILSMGVLNIVHPGVFLLGE